MDRRVAEAILATVVLLILIIMNYLDPGVLHSLASGWFFITVLYFYLQWVLGPEEPTNCEGLRDCLAKLWHEFYVSISNSYTNLRDGFLKTKFLVAIVVLVVQPIVLVLAFTLFPLIGCPQTPPAFLDLEHDLIRALSLVLLVGPLIEEYFFRRILQERLGYILSEKSAILTASFAFALYHLLPGTLLCEMLSLLLTFIRSLFYGLVYSRTHSFLASWIPHLGVNSLAIVSWLLFPVT